MPNGGWSDAEEKAILGWFFTGAAKTPPATLYLALCTGELLDTGSNIAAVETTYPGYARLTVASNGTNWGVASGDDPSIYDNQILFQFPICTGATADLLTHWGLMASLAGQTAGDLIFSGSLVGSLQMAQDVQPQFDANALQLRLGS